MMWNKWKAALIEVSNGKTTLPAPMGDWLDTQTHQESEWWLSVQERSIYRQNNGEWSQYAQQKFGRLQFSKTPRIVPHPNHCSHKIQVTQISQYHEVAAEINISPRQNVSSTSYHNYASGIGLSFLTIPRHIQRLTGDIPALPTPSPFDFDAPVDLIIAMDGSVSFGVGYHGCALATKDKKNLLRGGGLDDGIQSLMTSYGSKLGGLVASLAVLDTLFRAGTIKIRSIRFICDNESAVTAGRRPKSEIIFHNTKCDWDLLVTIQDLTVRWCNGIAFSFHWVKGNAYLIERPLKRDERLNIEADFQANVVCAQVCGRIAACPNCAHWEIKEASLSIRGSKVTSDMKIQPTSQMHDNYLFAFLMHKESWSTPHTPSTISTGMLASGPPDAY
jgi:hypothetical protein